MLKRFFSNPLRVSGLFLAIIVTGAFSGNPPDGYTGAPFDNHCQECHSGNNPNGFDGTAALTGLPAVIQPNTTYAISLQVQVTAGNPLRAGFQLVTVDANQNNAGNLTATNNETGTQFWSSREYIDHRNPKDFSGGTLSWNFSWTSPASAACNQVTFYYIVNFCNGSTDFGDKPKTFSVTYPLGPNAPLSISAQEILSARCFGSQDGSAQVITTGGTPPFAYMWSNGQSGQIATGLGAGLYAVSVSDASSCSRQASVAVDQPLPLVTTVLSVLPAACPEADSSGMAQLTGSGGTTPYTFIWPNGLSPNALPAGAYAVTLTDQNGCSQTDTVAVPWMDIVPPLLVCPADLTVCAGDTVYVDPPSTSDNCVAPAPVLTQIQGLPSGSTFPEGSTLQVFSATDAGQNTATCAFTVYGLALPAAALDTIHPDKGSAGIGAIFISPQDTGYSFQWFKNGLPISQLEDPDSLTAGAYLLLLENANGCSDTIGPFLVDNLSSARPVFSANTCSVFPTLVSDFFEWSCPDPDTPISLRVVNAIGSEMPVQATAHRINMNHFPPGLYWIFLDKGPKQECQTITILKK